MKFRIFWTHKSTQQTGMGTKDFTREEAHDLVTELNRDYCAEHLALGMLRDVAALRVGEQRAQTEYVALMKKHGKYPPQ